ncbi:branched-chain amino acid ABC transporter permease [Herbiconiux sp. KACC 21604]|uniref:branched-chain amino acid ABC transporter permease n=1 Tax=unclassified Herbiconiux TaxID=2618217 RepID=UPI001491D73D|nr:branched-chain amino acid ABC transporter permease [Herbiconiux sp. SALV-R1]QJU55310.1 branched-chain amino acid ABC transporter permease [Herbiconiux sp. SALV-R1]WPO86478.1 branched-chain amino acid ABC transporter permease [Herbiconiux sp. KACC 21604]
MSEVSYASQRIRAATIASRYWQPAVLTVFALAGAPLLAGTDVFPLLVLAGIYAIAVIGVSIFAGLGGQLTLGHTVFMAMGAYASAISALAWKLPPIAGVLIGVVWALLLAVITSPILRLRGWYLVMATIALVLMLPQLAANLGDVTGGSDGLYGIPDFGILGLEVQGESAYFVLAWLLVLVFFLLARNVRGSRFGRALAAIGMDPDAAAAAGIGLFRVKAVLWLLVCVPAAVAGSMFAHYSSFIAPTDFNFSVALTLFAAVIIGGERSIFLGIVVVVFLVTMPAYASGPFTVELIEALALIAVYLASPSGIAGIISATAGRRRARRERHA